MIELHQSREVAERQLWSGTVQNLFQSLGISNRTAAQEIVESVAVFCQQHTPVTAQTLSLLTARSFCVTGDTEAAGKILKNDRVHRLYAESWLDVLSSEYPFPELYPLFSVRALHPQRLTSAGTVWVLDFSKVQLTEADRHELILLQTVRVLTERVSVVWKKSNGQGTLGVKGLSRLTRLVRRRKAPDQLSGHMCDVLALCAQRNGWAHVPSILLLGH